MKINLMMLGDYPNDRSEIFGGTSAATYNLVKALRDYTDCKITTFSFWPEVTKKKVTSIDSGLQCIRLPRNYKLRWLTNFAGQRIQFKKYMRMVRPDIIHAQGEGLYASLAVNSGLPNLFTIHGVRLKELAMAKGKINYFRYLFMIRMVKKNHLKVKHIIAINNYTKEQVKKLGQAKIRIIRNAVNERYFELFDIKSPQEGKILMVGGVKRRKNNVDALKAFKIVLNNYPSASIDIVGPVEKDYLEEVMQLIDRLNIKHSVNIHGLVNVDKLNHLYLTSDILLMSSLEESSPIAIVEAMAAGKPIVATDVGGVKEMIEHATNGYLLDNYDNHRMAHFILEIISDRNKRQQFSKSSFQIAKKHWSSRSVAEETYKTYLEILNE